MVNAVVDALRHLGVHDIRMPCTPERVWRAINIGSTGARAAEGTIAYGGPQTATTAEVPMIPAEFDYVQPHSVDEAVTALGRAGEDAKVLAGGQSLLPLLRLRLAYPTALVDLGGVGELRGVRRDGDALVIGAMTTHHEVMHDPLVAAALRRCWPRPPARWRDPAVRHRGTFGGALAHADPAGDLPAVAAALDATFVIEGSERRRSVPAARLLLRLPGDGRAAGRGAGRGPGAGARPRLGQRVREVQPGRAGLGDRRRGRAGPRPRAARSPRPGSG